MRNKCIWGLLVSSRDGFTYVTPDVFLAQRFNFLVCNATYGSLLCNAKYSSLGCPAFSCSYLEPGIPCSPRQKEANGYCSCVRPFSGGMPVVGPPCSVCLSQCQRIVEVLTNLRSQSLSTVVPHHGFRLPEKVGRTEHKRANA